ncbi:MAG: ABC transporter ATP-binding protein [Agathobacter rectalis]
MQVIQIKDVCKAFDQRQVLNNISLSVEEGEIFGLLGPSGAGKTTLIKMLIGLLSATSGNIAILGKELDKKIDESFPSFGMVLDNDGLYDRLNCYDNLELYARIYSISNRKKVINDLLEKVGLIESSKKSVSIFLRECVRLSFARAILHSPKIVFLDEPTSGLDPATTLQIHSMMKTLKESGTTIFLTTHNMNEAQKMCDHLALLNEGNIVEEGTPEDICLHHRKKCEVNIEMTNGEKYMVDSHDLLTVLQTVLDTNNKIRSIHSNEPNLEEVFIELTGRDLR